MSSSKKGFTLIELLVVIAIIAILAAILFPVFARAKAKGQLQACLNNQKQWGNALQLYMSDHNDYFPWAGAADHVAHDARRRPLGIGGSTTVYEALKTYTKNSIAIRWCPLWPASARAQTVGWSYWYYCPHSGTNMSGNTWVSGYNGGKAALCGYNMSDLRYPSRKPAICEVSTAHRQGVGADSNYVYPILYCDGHVRAKNISGARWMEQEINALYVGKDGSVQYPTIK